MKKPININTKGQLIQLNAGKYKIDILGGWFVELGNFSVSIRHTEKEELINAQKKIGRAQMYAFNKRAKRIFVIDVPVSGKYEIIFKHSDTITVKRTNLFIASLFEKAIPSQHLEIYFYR